MYNTYGTRCGKNWISSFRSPKCGDIWQADGVRNWILNILNLGCVSYPIYLLLISIRNTTLAKWSRCFKMVNVKPYSLDGWRCFFMILPPFLVVKPPQTSLFPRTPSVSPAPGRWWSSPARSAYGGWPRHWRRGSLGGEEPKRGYCIM
jgi:hypothetical protein